MAIGKFFDRKTLGQLAKATKFIQRKSKLSAEKFLDTLMFVHQQGKDLSLLDMCGDLHIQHGLRLKKQSIHERFNEYAVSFMKSILSKLLESQLNTIGKKKDSHFSIGSGSKILRVLHYQRPMRKYILGWAVLFWIMNQ